MSSTWDQMSHRDQLAAMHYDFYKSVHGVRPRWIDYDNCTEQELEIMLEQLSAESAVQEAAERKAQAKAIDEFELRVATLVASGAKSRDQAITWIRQSENAEFEDNDYVCFLLGLPYGYFEKEAA